MERLPRLPGVPGDGRMYGSDSLAAMPAPELASVDGSITGTGDARIPPGDDGLLRGDGVFEVIRLYRGTPFALGDHLDRLRALGRRDRAAGRP